MNKKEYIRQYMREYRQGKRRKKKNDEIRKKIKQDRLNGDDIYTIAYRYDYNPSSVARLCQDLPIKKHVNRHKLFYGFINK
jgi:cytochrome c553